MLTIREEMMVFVSAILAGLVVRFVYKCMTTFRKVLPHKLWVVNVEDICFGLGSGLYLFVQIYHTSDGSIRWYSILGIVLGLVLASLSLRKIEKVTKKIYTSKKEKNFELLAKKRKKRYDK